MPVKVNITVDTRKIKDFKLADDGMITKALDMASGRYIQLQKKRVKTGKKSDGSGFDAYNPEYRDKKSKADRDLKKDWLRLSGHMMRSHQVSFEKKGNMIVATIGFSGTRPRYTIKLAASEKRKKKENRVQKYVVVEGKGKVSNALLAAMNEAKRPFVGVSPKEAEMIKKAFVDELVAQINSKRSKISAAK